MVGADHLIVVDGLHHKGPPLFGGVNDRRRQLEVDVVEMHHIRVKLFQHGGHFAPRLQRVEDFEGIEEPGGGIPPEIHMKGIQARPVAHGVAPVVHAEILHLMAPPGQALPDLQHVGLRAAPGVEKFVYHQNFHVPSPSSRFSGDT